MTIEPKAWTVARAVVWTVAMVTVILSFVATLWAVLLGLVPPLTGGLLTVVWVVILFFTAATRPRASNKRAAE